MANVGIEKQDVFGAADEILAGGKEPTIQAIREKLGTGSLTTISKHLKDWQASKRNQSPIAKAPLAFELAAQNLWTLAFREAERLLQAQREALALDQQRWEEEKKFFSGEVERLEIEKISQEKKIKELSDSLGRELTVRDQLSRAVSEAGEHRARLQGEIDALKERLKDESERGLRLEKEISSIAKGKK